MYYQCFGSASFWCGSGSADPLPGIVDPVPEPTFCQIKYFFFKQIFCNRYIRYLKICLFFVFYELIRYSCVFNRKVIKKKKYSYLFFIIFFYLDPDPRFLKWIRPNDTDPTVSGSETLPYMHFIITKYIYYNMKQIYIGVVISNDDIQYEMLSYG